MSAVALARRIAAVEDRLTISGRDELRSLSDEELDRRTYELCVRFAEEHADLSKAERDDLFTPADKLTFAIGVEPDPAKRAALGLEQTRAVLLEGASNG